MHLGIFQSFCIVVIQPGQLVFQLLKANGISRYHADEMAALSIVQMSLETHKVPSCCLHWEAQILQISRSVPFKSKNEALRLILVQMGLIANV